jgi:hypothetical protein
MALFGRTDACPAGDVRTIQLSHLSRRRVCYGHGLDATPDLDLPDEDSVPVDVRMLVDEARISCTSGMLLCLDRQQRLVYILAEIFEVTDAVGAELLEISRENFRQRLARARRDLHRFMNDECGLVNRANPCRCAKNIVISAVTSLLLPLVEGEVALAAIYGLAGLGVAAFTPSALSLVGDAAAPGRAGHACAWYSTAHYGAIGVGPFVGGVVAEWWGYRAAFLASGVGIALALVVAIALPLKSAAPATAQPRATFANIRQNASVWAGWVVAASGMLIQGWSSPSFPSLVTSGVSRRRPSVWCSSSWGW